MTENNLFTDNNDPTYFLSNGKRIKMRVFITYGGERVSMDIPLGWTVARVKRMLIQSFGIPENQNVQLGDEARNRTSLVLKYAGADMPDDWVLSDLSICPGATLKAYMKSIMDPVLYFRLNYRNEEIIPVMEHLKLSELKVDSLRSIASRLSGLPVSVFRMLSPKDKDMFDCNMVYDYEIKPGDKIRIETWDGWNQFLEYCSLGFTDQVFQKFNTDDIMKDFQIKVAMYMAAHFGHSDLASRLCRINTVRPDDPVGLHPLRQWQSLESRHIDSWKAPVHESVECNQSDVLRIFAHCRPTCILARDGRGLQPLNIALRKRMRKCASFLLTKQWSRVPFGNTSSVPIVIFHRLIKWADAAKEKVSVRLGVEKSNRPVASTRTFPLLGQGIYVDGYSVDQMHSLPHGPPKISYYDKALDEYYDRVYKIPKINPIPITKRPIDTTNSSSATRWNQLTDTGFKLPSINEAKFSRSRTSSIQSIAGTEFIDKTKSKPIKKDTVTDEKTAAAALLLKKSSSDGGDKEIPLPIRSIDDTPRPHFIAIKHKKRSRSNDSNETNEEEIDNEIVETIKKYYNTRGYSPRQHAIECLKITNKLKEKPWLHQVRIAMQVSKESVRKSVRLS